MAVLVQVFKDYRENIPMGILSKSFSAKEMAILRCTDFLLTKNITKRRIHICFDSRAVSAALAKTTTISFLVLEYMQALGNLCELDKVTLA
jgi:hypothetical protein